MFVIWVLTFTLFFNDGRLAERHTIASINPMYCELARDTVGSMTDMPSVNHIDINLSCVEERAS
jgi:hypothetical protein